MSFIPGMGGGSVLGAGNILIGADTSRLRGQVRQGVNGVRQELNAGAQEVSRSSQRWGAAFNAIGMAAKIGMIGVVTAVGAGIGAAIQFESAWAGVRKTLDATPEELAALRQDFRNLAKEIPVSVNELARIGETAGALGIAKESVLEFTKVVSTIGQTTNVSTDAAATALGQLSNVLKMDQADYSRFAATLVDLGNKGASTESQILEITSRAGAAGGTIGLTTREVMAFASATANLGIEVEAGGSSLQNFFMKMNMIVGSGAGINKLAKDVGLSFDQFVAVVQKGGDPLKQLAAAVGKTSAELTGLVGKSMQLKQVADVAGVTGQEFVTAFTEKAGPALVSFLNGLSRVPAAERQMVLTGLKMNDIRITRMLLGMAGNTDNLTNSLAVAEAAWTANTAATEEAEKRYETTGSQIGLLKNILQDYIISLGEQALPVFKALVTALRDNLPKALDYVARVWNTTLKPALTPMVEAFGELGAAIAGIFGMEGEAANWGGVMKTAFQGIANVIGTVADGVTIVVKGFTWLIDNPLGQWAARLVALFIGVRTAISGVGYVLDSLNRKSARLLGGVGGNKGFLNWMSFGLIGQKAGTGASAAPEVQAARALTGSAADLSGSAAQLDRAARVLAGGAGAGPARWLGQTPVNPLRYVGPPGPATPLGGVQEKVARNAYAAGSAVQQAEARRLAQPNSPLLPAMDPVAARTGVKAAIAGAGRAVLGGISKVFWPLLIADLALEFMKEPLGDFIAANTEFKRAGAKMKEDFFGGLVALVQSWSSGSDLRVAIEEATGSSVMTTSGGQKFDTANLRGFNLRDEDIAALLDPTIENRGLDMWAYSQAEALTGAMKKKGDETFTAWVQRVTEELERNNITTAQVDAILADTSNYGPMNPYGQRGPLSDEAKQRITDLLSRDIGTLATNTIESARQALKDGVIQSIIATTSGRVSLTNLMKLTPDQIRQLGLTQSGVQAGTVSDTAAALQLGSMLKAAGTPLPAEPKGKFPLGYDPAMRGRGYQTPESAAMGSVRQQRQNIADAQKALDESLAEAAKTNPAGVAAAEFFVETFAAEIKKAGQSEKNQKAVMESLNDLMKRAGRETRFTEWSQVLAFTEEQQLIVGGPMKEQIAAALKNWSVEAARLADPEGVKVFLEKWGPAIASADTKKERTALREKLNALIPGKDDDLTSNKKMMEWIAGVTEQGTADAAAAEAEKETPTLGSFFESLFSKGPVSAISTLAESLQGSIGQAIADNETVSTWTTAGSALMDALIAGINLKAGAVKSAVDGVLIGVGDSLPGSPVKSGPLKHPFLIEAGKQIVGQIGQGINAATLPFPDLETPKIGDRRGGAVGGKRTQNLYATNLNILGPADEESVLARVAFLSNV